MTRGKKKKRNDPVGNKEQILTCTPAAIKDTQEDIIWEPVRSATQFALPSIPFIKSVFCLRLPVGFTDKTWNRECGHGIAGQGNLAITVVGSTPLQYPREVCIWYLEEIVWCRSVLTASTLCCPFIPVPPGAWKHPQPSRFAKIQTLTLLYFTVFC